MIICNKNFMLKKYLDLLFGFKIHINYSENMIL